ncbi:hypothetical protein KP509_1Z132200 [Ceratopteris richardii]|nr:hypothetical protein KP509_1Z132200 [Ceratopteris richardii]
MRRKVQRSRSLSRTIGCMQFQNQTTQGPQGPFWIIIYSGVNIMSVESLKMERDAAIRARDDLAAQLRVMKKRLQDAEEEQYKAEEDNASLRAELEFLHHKEEDRKLIASSAATDRYDLLEQEVAILKIELQNALRRVQEEQQAVANEQQRSAKLVAEHEQLKLELAEAKSIHEGHQDSITRALNEDLLKVIFVIHRAVGTRKIQFQLSIVIFYH